MHLLLLFSVLIPGAFQWGTCPSGSACINLAGDAYCEIIAVQMACETDPVLQVLCKQSCRWCYDSPDDKYICYKFIIEGDNFGWCKDLFIAQICPQTCNTFQGCGDKFGYDCSRPDTCSSDHYMRMFCKKTCGICARGCFNEPARATGIDCLHMNKAKCKTDIKLQSYCREECGMCAKDCFDDLNKFDFCQKHMHQCNTDKTVQKTCKETCGLCNAEKCENKFPSCPKYAPKLCLDPTRRDLCRKSCQRCRNGSTGCDNKHHCINNLECLKGVCTCPEYEPIYDNITMTCKKAVVVGNDVFVADVTENDVPVKNMTANDLPAKEMPVKNGSAEEMLVKDVPAKMPVKNVLVKEMPVKDVPAMEMPVKDVPAKDMLVKDVLVNAMPVKEVPVKEMPVKDMPVKEMPVKDVPAKEMPVKDMPVKEMPVKDVPEQAVSNVDGITVLQRDE